MFKVESDFEYKGYRCVTIFTDRGHRCGYVGVTENSKFYGKSFNDITHIRLKDLHEPLGKRSILTLFGAPESEDGFVRLDLLFDVHGGLTYGESGRNCAYPVESDLWWLGFDCAHCDDGKDLDLVEELWGDDKEVKRYLEIEREINEKYPTVKMEAKSKDYVMDECRSLVEQIIKWEKKDAI